MLAALWLALAAPPVFIQPLPESPGEPSAVALVAGRADLRRPCYHLVCEDAGWRAPNRFTRIGQPKAPGSVDPLAKVRLPVIAARHYPLYSPARRRDWRSNHGSHSRFTTSFGYEAVRTPDTQVKLEFGTGYRLQPYADYGTASEGPIARGRLELRQSIADRALLTQNLLVETGRFNTTTRQVIGLDLQLQPQWTLHSNFELRHDSAGNGGSGATDTEGSMHVRYRF
ncbi:DUF481 domain-containing protein [Luteimonas arsenica]|uniref:DUF481 domain-containing protein n=1 Tax=Luteimonas arsenica TaxID=1586242 RepID=UPI001056B0C3|nr:DUF481 domain-containing protein [Luteimonas arsenica]